MNTAGRGPRPGRPTHTEAMGRMVVITRGWLGEPKRGTGGKVMVFTHEGLGLTAEYDREMGILAARRDADGRQMLHERSANMSMGEVMKMLSNVARDEEARRRNG